MRLYQLLLLLIMSVFCYGQNNQIKFDHLTIEDGLSQGTVHSILQDNRGFMWFGTRFGLNRYDGHEFKVFAHNPEDKTSLPGYRILNLCMDHSGTIWVGTETNGLARYNQTTENFHNFHFDPADSSSLSSNLITCIFEDSEQTLWIGTQDGLNRLDKNGQGFSKYYHLDNDSTSLPSNHISALSEVSPGILLVGTGSGEMAEFDIGSSQFTEIRNEQFWPSNSSNRGIQEILKDRNHDYFWVSRLTYGLTKFSLSEGILENYRLFEGTGRVTSTDFIFSICQDQDGRLWLATVGGLTLFNPQTETFIFNTHDDSKSFGLGDEIIYSVFNDDQGLVWAGGDSQGLNIYKPNQIRFELFSHSSANSQGPSGNDIYSIIEDRFGDIWFTSLGGGTNRFNPTTGTYRYYQTDDTKRGVWSMSYAMKVMIDQYDKVWIGTAVAGLSQVDPQSGERLKLYYNNWRANSLSGPTIYSFSEARDGTIWIGTMDNGLNRFNREADNFTNFAHDKNDKSSIGGDRIYALLEDESGVLWVGTAKGGLNRFYPESQSFTSFTNKIEDKNSIGSNCILDLYEDSENNLWIATKGGGLNKLDPQRKNFSRLDLGFENQNIITYSIEQDDQGYLWISTNKGLIKADPEHGFLNHYTSVDGLQGNEFLYGSSLKDSRGYIYFGGPNGLNRFHPDSVLNNAHIPPVVITKFKINYEEVPIGKMPDGRTVLDKSITETRGIVLIHQDKVISITYSALDYSSPDRNRFAYKLDNFDENWIQAGFDHTVTYTSLEPGDYTFHVKASNNDGVWNDTGVSVDITVLPPYWQTWWFRLLLSLILVFMVLMYVRLRFRRMEIEKRKLEKLVIERTAELKLEIEERQRVETEKMQLNVDHLKRELVSKSMHVTENQDNVNALIGQLKDMQKLDNNEMRQGFNGIIRYSKNLFKSGQDWDEFEKWFAEVHTDFFENILSEYPELTQRELKVCALIRINLVTKDISNLMKVQPKTIQIYRHRIRHKLGLTSDENLNHYLVRY
ncbi:hypothetical protein HQ531_10200 [bacterium]|nr:hypothetical protein [bacterium]